ncbi:hypothetical protein RF11_03942 [Thelohanellus kitauei]|uniref:Uncharacterized protein n=1 Tax=Thelohanellus kitauei TaxID=669202 RepID=A0A0C2NIN2_THEKT|nr:hypothetical protein RF11_03942 [Thelohanellus kitauei]
MNNEMKYKRVFPCPGTKKQQCSCMENYVQKRTSSESDPKYNKEDAVMKEIIEFQNSARLLSKEPGEIEDSKGNIKVDSNGRTRVSMKIKSRRYIQFIVEKRDYLRGYGVCQVS